MLQLIETICFEHGKFQRISLHEERMNRSRHMLFGIEKPISFGSLLRIPSEMAEQKIRCRVTYAETIENIEYEEYILKNIGGLLLVFDDSIDYSHKFRNRDCLNHWLNQRGTADEILIVKNGRITDTSFSNIVFLRNGTWFTPEYPLLPGTRRADYLEKKMIFPANIRPDDLNLYEEARLINAMRPLEDAEPIPISKIN
ncbi:MAG: aminotransferase class IV [Prolixibacteraceae bacterium]